MYVTQLSFKKIFQWMLENDHYRGLAQQMSLRKKTSPCHRAMINVLPYQFVEKTYSLCPMIFSNLFFKIWYSPEDWW